MKKLLALLLILSCILCFAGCAREKTAEELVQEAFDNVDREHVEQIKDKINRSEASANGDTYCTNCKKFSEGSVRICSHCGQYIK